MNVLIELIGFNSKENCSDYIDGYPLLLLRGGEFRYLAVETLAP